MPFHIHARTGYLLARSKSCGSERCRPTVLYALQFQTGVRRDRTINSVYYGEICFPPIKREATDARTYLLESDVRVQTMDVWSKATSERTAGQNAQPLVSSGSVDVEP